MKYRLWIKGTSNAAATIREYLPSVRVIEMTAPGADAAWTVADVEYPEETTERTATGQLNTWFLREGDRDAPFRAGTLLFYSSRTAD